MPIRKINPGYCNLTARVPSKKLERMTDAESSLERDFLFLLEHNSNVTHFEEQPLTIELGGFSYTPDVFVTYKDGSKYLYEVKYRSELNRNWQKLKPKFKAAIKYCKTHDTKFKIITDIEIRTPYLKNIEFLSHFNRTLSPIESSITETLLSELRDFEGINARELLAICFSSKLKQAEAAPILWRLIFKETICVDLQQPLSMYSPLYLSEDVLEAV